MLTSPSCWICVPRRIGNFPSQKGQNIISEVAILSWNLNSLKTCTSRISISFYYLVWTIKLDGSIWPKRPQDKRLKLNPIKKIQRACSANEIMSWSKRRKIFETITMSSKKHSSLISSHCFISSHTMSRFLYIIFLDRIFGNFDMLFRMPLNPKPSVKVTETYKLNWGSHPTKCHPSSWKRIFRTPGGLEFFSWDPPRKHDLRLPCPRKPSKKIHRTSGGCCLSCQDIQIVVLKWFKPLFLVFPPNKGDNFYPTHQKQRDVLNGKSPVTLWFWRFCVSKTLLGRKAHHSWRPLSLPQYDRAAWNTLKSPPSFKWLLSRICHWADGLSKVSWDDGLVPPRWRTLPRQTICPLLREVR